MTELRIRDAVEVPMRDGTRLVSDIWLPDGDGPWPVLLQRTPYRREDVHGAQFISALEFQSALRRGFAVMVQDTRGRFASSGEFTPFRHEEEDGADTLRWLRAQNFCDGRVAMFGASYVGATQVLAAAGHPEGLCAIAPQLTTGRHGESWAYRGGATELGFLLLWIIEALGPADLERRIPTMEPDTVERAANLLARMQADPQGAFSRLPVLDDDLRALAPYAAEWFDDARAQGAAADREHLDRLAEEAPPMLVTAGWNDLFLEGSLELFETVRSRRRDGTEVPDRLIIGPWSHGNPRDWQGMRWYGYSASTEGLSDTQLDFFEAAIDGRSPTAPVVRYFRSGSNSWHVAPDWPLPNSKPCTFHLDETRLTETPSGARWERGWVSNPASPVPTAGGATFLPGLLLGRNSGPIDQTDVEARNDVVTFTSAPLERDVEVTGLVVAQLVVSSSAETSDWTARLCEVDDEGRSFGLVDGIARIAKMVSGTPTDVEVRLGHLSHLFSQGSRLRLQVASSNFPRFDRNPQSGAAPAQAAGDDFRPASQMIFGGGQFQSKLVLPTVPAAYPVAGGLVAS